MPPTELPPAEFPAESDPEQNPLSGVTTQRVPSIAPTARLSRRGLVLGLITMAGLGLSVYAMFPDAVGGPALPVTARVERQPVETQGGGVAVLTDVVVIENQADHEIKRLAIEINDQYLLFQQAPLSVGESLVLPLRVFTDKRSSQRYDPSRYPAEKILVRGQLPSGSRGVSVFDVADEAGTKVSPQ